MCLKGDTWEFPGGLLVRILGFHYRGWGSIPGQGTEILQGKVYSQKSTKKKKGGIDHHSAPILIYCLEVILFYKSSNF